jgi:hypothetical protein
MAAKLLFIDIETAPILMTSWSMRPPYAGAVWVERDTLLLMASYKWSHEKSVKTVCLPDFPRYKRHKHDDKDLCRVLHSLLDEADIVCAHNGDQFDTKKINSRLIVHNLRPPSPYKTVDTLKIARRMFKFDSNKLDNIGRYLNEGRKIPNTGATLWRGCVEGDEKSWRTMRRYGKQDTALLVKAYERLRSWAPSHPDVNLYKAYQDKAGCPKCGSEDTQRRGIAVKQKWKYYRFQCQGCGGWFSGMKVT